MRNCRINIDFISPFPQFKILIWDHSISRFISLNLLKYCKTFYSVENSVVVSVYHYKVMSPKTPKKSNDKKIADDVKRLTRKPLYPNLNEDKENREFCSSETSSEQSPNGHSPLMPKKSKSPSSKNSMQDISGSPKTSRECQEHQKLRCKLCQKKQKNDFQEGKNSDEDWETDTENEKLIQPERQLPKTEPSTGTSDFTLKYSLIFFIAIPFICLFFYNIYWTRNSYTSSMNDQLNASTLVTNLKSKFKDQPPLTFRIIHSALKRVLGPQPEAPAVILLLATSGSKTVCRKLAYNLVDSLSVPDYFVNISGEAYKQNPDHAKKKIDESILSKLKEDRLGSVLIEDLDQIPGQAAVILHKFSDHENAPFKKAVFVMTINYNKAISNYSDTTVWDKAAYDHLLSVWTDLGIDQATPLLSRLAVSVAVIKV